MHRSTVTGSPPSIDEGVPPQKPPWWRNWKVLAAIGVVALGGFEIYQDRVGSPTIGEDFNEEFMAELEAAGVSESAIECATRKMEDGGYLQALDDLESETLRSAVEDFKTGRIGVNDLPPEFQQFIEGYAIATSECFSLQDMEAMGGSSLTDQGYGDNAHQDALWLRCETGDFLACDLLSAGSGVGTEYQRYGRSCGERSEPETSQWCVYLHGDGPDLDQYHADCLDGDFIACDGLYAFSPIGSEYERAGATCGGRIDEPPPEMAGLCLMRFGVGG